MLADDDVAYSTGLVSVCHCPPELLALSVNSSIYLHLKCSWSFRFSHHDCYLLPCSHAATTIPSIPLQCVVVLFTLCRSLASSICALFVDIRFDGRIVFACPSSWKGIHTVRQTVGVKWFVNVVYPHKGNDDVVDTENILCGALDLALTSKL